MRLHNHWSRTLILASGLLALSSCNILDREPLDQVGPADYYTTAEQIGTFTINYYASLFPGHGSGGYHAGIATYDNGTDNQATTNPNRTMFSNSSWKVESTGQPSIASIRNVNWYMEQVLPKFYAGKIVGTQADINHYIGEAYAIRALLYYDALKSYGDFPIITQTLPIEQETLQKASQRRPRNEVARFILSELDSAIKYLKPTFPMNQRLTKNAAQLLKSRVALYEGTFEKHHRGTGRVPGDATWPGKDKEWNKGKVFDQDAEVKFFLGQAMASAKIVADAVSLTPNSHEINPPLPTYSGWNSYYEMFASRSLESFSEILLWRQYSKDKKILHLVSHQLISGTNSGWTRGLVESFLMKDGTPYYKRNTATYNDETIDNVKKDRDERLQLFLFAESDARTYDEAKKVVNKYECANMIDKPEVRDVTGYAQRKYYNYDPAMRHGSEMNDVSGVPILRASEAYLNYIEASYELNKTLDADARKYWDALRARAGITGTIDATIAATDMSVEANVNRPSYDWGAFSQGQPVDPTLYSIRRERRCEFAGEGIRHDDLVRWCAMDQVKNYVIEGVNFWTKIHKYPYFWGTKKEKVTGPDGKVKEVQVPDPTTTRVIADGSSKSNISQQSLGLYHRPYQIISKANNNDMFDGYTFYQAHYLSPVSIQTLELCAPNNQIDATYFYQNINWPTNTNNPYAIK
jgi:susD family protein